MFDIGFLELSIILILSLLVLGPERLPKAARTVGYWFGKARRYVEGMKSQVEAEFDSTEVKRLLHNQEVQIRELQNKIQNGEDYINSDYHDQFENREDPGTDIETQEKKPAGPQYDMIEEDDERWDELPDSNPEKQDEIETDESHNEVVSEEPDKSQSTSKTQ